MKTLFPKFLFTLAVLAALPVAAQAYDELGHVTEEAYPDLGPLPPCGAAGCGKVPKVKSPSFNKLKPTVDQARTATRVMEKASPIISHFR